MQYTQVLYDSGEDSVDVREPRVEGTLEVNGKSFNVMTGENIIGRDPELSSIVLQYQAISAEHAKIDAGPDGHTLCDAGSRNKTKLKEKVLKPHVQYFLEDGDTIFFADIKAVYHISPEEDEKTNGNSEVIPETPARLPRSADDNSLIIPETPDAKDTSALDESFIPSSQFVTDSTLINDVTSSETSFVASSQPPSRPSTSGAQRDNNMETPVAGRTSSRLRSSIQSQASLNLVLNESLTDNGTPQRSLEDRSDGNATNAPVNGESIYEADTQLIAFSSTSIVVETPDKPDSQSSTPDRDESSIYGANTQIVFSPDSFKKPPNRSVRKLSLAKRREECENGSRADLGLANDSIYEASTQLIFPSDIDSPTVEGESQNGTPGREERLYEADTQVLPSPKSHRSARKKVQFSVEGGSDDGTPRRRNEDIYEAKTQVIPHSNVREEVYEAETQVLPGFIEKNPVSGSEDIHEAETQVLPGLVEKNPASGSEDIHEAETQVLPGLVEKNPASGSEDIHEAETQVLLGLVEKNPASGSEDVHEAETQVLPRIVKNNLDYEAETQLLPDRETGIAEVEDQSIYDAETQAVTIPVNPSNEDKSDGAGQSGAKPGEDNENVCDNQKDNLDRKKSTVTSNKQTGPDQGKLGNSHSPCRASNRDNTDCEDTSRKNDKSEVQPTTEETANDEDETEDNIFNCPTQKIAPKAIKKTENKKSFKENDSDETDDEDMFSCLTQKITRKAPTKVEDTKSSKANDSDETDDQDMFTSPTRKIMPKSLKKSEDKKSSKANDSDETDDEDIFSCPTQKITRKALTKSQGKKTSETNDGDKLTCTMKESTPMATKKTENKKSSKENDSDDTDDEDMFTASTQKITLKAPTKIEDSKSSKANDSDETDDEGMFTSPTRKITKKAPKKTEDKKSSKVNDSDETDDEDMFTAPTQKITPRAPKKTEDKKSSRAKDSDETDDEDMFSAPTQKITVKAPTKIEDTKSSKANDSDETDDEDMFTAPTQKITLENRTKSDSKRSSGMNDGDETDDEEMFLCPTQKITPTRTEDRKTSEVDFGDKEDFFNCPTQKIPVEEKIVNRPTELTGTVAEVGSESILMDGDTSNDSVNLLRDYNDDDVETSPSPDVSPVEEAQSPEEAVRDSTPDDLATSLTKDIETRQDTPNAKRKERHTDQSGKQTEEQIEEPVKERHEELHGKRCKERIEDQRERLTEERIEGLSKERSAQQHEDRTEEQSERHLEGLAQERLGHTKETSETRREERIKERRGKRSEKPIDVVENAALLLPVNDKLDVSLEGTSGLTRSEQVRPDEPSAIHPEEKTKLEMELVAASVKEDQTKRKRGRPKISISRCSVTAHSTSENSSQNDVIPDKTESERAETPLQEEGGPESSQQRRLGRPAKATEQELELGHDPSIKVSEKPVVKPGNDIVLPSGLDTPRSKRGKVIKTSSQTLVVESKPREKASAARKPVDSDKEEVIEASPADRPRLKRGKLTKTSSQPLVLESPITKKFLQSSVDNSVEKHPEEDKHLPSITESPRPKRGILVNTNSQTSAAESKPTEELTSAEKSVQSESENDRVLLRAAASPRPKRGKLAKTSTSTSAAESTPNEKLTSAEKSVETESEDSRIALSAAASSRPKRGKLSKTSSQRSAAESKPNEKLTSAEAVESESEDGRIALSAAASPRPKREKRTKRSIQITTTESTEKLTSAEKLVESESEDGRVALSAAASPRPKREKRTKRSTQITTAESTEKLAAAEKPVESESEDGRLMPSAAASSRPKGGRLSKTSSQTSAAVSKPTVKSRRSSTKEPEEKRDSDEGSLPSTSESPRPKRGKVAKTNSQVLAESKPAEKLRQSSVEKHEEKQDRVLPSASESHRPKHGKQTKRSSQTLVADSKLGEKLRQNSIEMSAENRDVEERVLPDGSETPRPMRGRVSRTSSQTLIEEPKPTEKLSKKSTEKSAQKRGSEEASLLRGSSETPQTKKGKFSSKGVSLSLEAENSNEREETANSTTKGGNKRSSPQSYDEKRSKRVKVQEMPAIDENVLKSKGRRQLYSPSGPDKMTQDSEEENDVASTPNDEPSSEDISTRRSGRVKKPTWKIRGGDTGLTKKLVLSYSQDTDDAAAVSSEDESSVKLKKRGRPKKSDLTPQDSPAESRLKKADPQLRTTAGRFAKRKGVTEEEPSPSKVQKMDVPRRSTKVRGSKLEPEESDCESICSEVAAARPGRRRRVDSCDSVQTPLTRSSSMTSETQSPSRRNVQRQPKQVHRVLFTGFADGKLEKLVLQLGAKIVDSVDEATVAVTDKLRRTVKLLSMMARGQPIVSPEWITQSQKVGHFRDPWECILSDDESEKKFDFNMERSLRTACSKKLLDGYTIFVTKSVSPPPNAMEEIIKSSGGMMVKKILPSWPEKSVIISCQSDAAQLKKIRKPPPVVVAEWLLSGVLQQRLDAQSYKLS